MGGASIHAVGLKGPAIKAQPLKASVIVVESEPGHYLIHLNSATPAVVDAVADWLRDKGIDQVIQSSSLGFISAAVSKEMAVLFKLTWGGSIDD